MPSKNLIFVQIVSYRDPELIPTVLNLVETARFPKNLRIHVAWQHDEYERLSPIQNLIEYIDIPYVDSDGVCWARNLIQQKYNGEKYALQLDSHHRFIQNWDSELIEMYKKCQTLGSEKPIITTYLPDFNSLSNKYTNEMWGIELNRFLEDGPLFFNPKKLSSSDIPIHAKFFSGHFSFSSGNFIREIPYDPNYYFYGEETNISARSFTHGYDLYHPNKIVAWHQYSREYRPTHWKDNKNWSIRDQFSTKYHRQLFEMEKSEIKFDNKYKFGNKRTLNEFESFVGISFKNKEIKR
jgi:hypothetical protein